MEKHLDVVGQSAAGGGIVGGIVIWGLSLPDWAAIVSIVVAVAGLGLHFWAIVRKDRRAEEAHQAALEGKLADSSADEEAG